MADERGGGFTLVTGAGGFIGANLVRRLLTDGVDVVGTVRPGSDNWRLADLSGHVRLRPVDLADHDGLRELIMDLRPQRVFHLATSRAEGDPVRLTSCNVTAVAALLGASEEVGVGRFVNAGSSLEYGSSPVPYQEDAQPAPTSSFGASKAAGTMWVGSFGRRRRVSTVNLRPFHVYGPWEDPSRFVSTAIRAVAGGETLPLTPPGFSHDLVFVDDVVEAFVRAASIDTSWGSTFNVCNGRSRTNEEVVDVLESIMGRQARRQVGAFEPRSVDRREWHGDPTKAEEVLGWTPRFDLQEGLRRTVSWIEACS